MTLQSFLAQGLLDGPLHSYIRRGSKKFKALCAILKDLQVLVLEELPTFPVPLLDKVEHIFREAMAVFDPANNFKPWGGIQVIVNGDPKQSMKIARRDDPTWSGYEGVDYIFELGGFQVSSNENLQPHPTPKT